MTRYIAPSGCCAWPAGRRRTGFGAALSEPPGHHHGALPGRRTDRRDRPHGRAIHGRRRSNKASSSRISAVAAPSSAPRRSRAPRPTATRCCCTTCRSPRTSRCTKRCPSTPSKISRPVMLVNRNPLVLVGRSTLEPNTLADLVALMKKQELKAAIPGYGTTGHLATSLLAQEAKVKLAQIPYRGAAPAVTDLAGRPDRFVLRHSAIGGATGGHRKIKGLRSDREGQNMPELPTAESLPAVFGPKLDVVYWQATVRARRNARASHQDAQ